MVANPRITRENRERSVPRTAAGWVSSLCVGRLTDLEF